MKRVTAASLLVLLVTGVAIPSASAAADEQAIVHLLSRATFGPRPGDVARVRAMGPAAWLEAQLHPARIEDTVCDAALQSLTTLGMSIADLLREYPRPDPRAREQM
jgi:hypothetical protein